MSIGKIKQRDYPILLDLSKAYDIDDVVDELNFIKKNKKVIK